ncbi:MAG: DUF721 domain-containing protein [Roseitalea sp.]|jgi:hypothetical protein|nr:DUF721 domain-containing protein [Roseitalea sp.]MBO6721972.1 DUF721 domain-containing protein [Roseitalea sp.]MBO6743410.1 DUF721 domain-containing protein [Roseitalea sp.]
MAKSAANLVNAVLDPVLAKRAGLSLALIDAWPEIAGAPIAEASCPLKIDWPRRRREDDAFEPGVLVVAAEAMAALHIQHQTGEIVARINAFMGFDAVCRIKLVQKQLAEPPKTRREPRPLSAAETDRIDRLADGFDDAGLRDAVRRLGRSVLSEKPEA